MTASLSHARRPGSSSPPPRPGPTRGRCTGRCATTTRCTTSSPRTTRTTTTTCCPGTPTSCRRPRPRDVLLGAGPHRQLRRAGDDRAGRQPADGDAGPAGAHRVPQAGVPRLHAAPGRGRRAQGAASSSIERIERLARRRRRRHRRRAVQAAAVDGRRALPRRARGGPRPVRRLDRRDRRRQHRRGRHRRRARDARRGTRRR